MRKQLTSEGELGNNSREKTDNASRLPLPRGKAGWEGTVEERLRVYQEDVITIVRKHACGRERE